MNYWGILLYVVIIILIIIIAILFTIGIDQLERINNPTNTTNDAILTDAIAIGSFIVIFIIFLIALGLIIPILIYYSSSIPSTTPYIIYAIIALLIFTFGTLILEIYFYRQFLLYNPLKDDVDTFNSSKSYFEWAIGLTLFILILILISIFLI